MLQRIVPQVKTCVAHGQMEGEELEKVMHDFVRGDYDVLIATTIIESGLDIPNANTMIINQAQNYGLSDLHQLRGRVGRSNKKAFCYLLTPPLDTVNSDARRRLKAIEDFSGLGSGFNIAMQDLDIRGAGNILGAEQSGFIAEIGYETYQRILNEALLELREEEFPGMETPPTEQKQAYVADCVIESDFEVLIPDTYVENISERIRLYRELDNIPDEAGLEKFGARAERPFWRNSGTGDRIDGNCEDETPVYGFRDREIIGKKWENDHVFCRRTDFSFLSVGLVCRYTEVCAAANFCLAGSVKKIINYRSCLQKLRIL